MVVRISQSGSAYALATWTTYQYIEFSSWFNGFKNTFLSDFGYILTRCHQFFRRFILICEMIIAKALDRVKIVIDSEQHFECLAFIARPKRLCPRKSRRQASSPTIDVG